jgi:flagellar protein FliS
MSFAVGQYQATHVETASPEQLVVLLYDGALRFLRQASVTTARQHALRGTALHRAHAIVAELQATLRPEVAPELCAELDRLYGFVLDRISESTLAADPAPLAGAIQVLERLRDAWAQVAKESR